MKTNNEEIISKKDIVNLFKKINSDINKNDLQPKKTLSMLK